METSLLNLGSGLYCRIIRTTLVDHILNFLSVIPSIDKEIISCFDTLYQVSQVKNQCEASLEVTNLVNTIIEHYRPLLPFVLVKGCDYNQPWKQYHNAFHHFATNPKFHARLEYCLLFSITNANWNIGVKKTVVHFISEEQNMPLDEKIRWLQSFLKQGSDFKLHQVNPNNKTVYELMCDNHPEDSVKFSFLNPNKPSLLEQRSIFALSIKLNSKTNPSDNSKILEENTIFEV